jgi:hypothetical protein
MPDPTSLDGQRPVEITITRSQLAELRMLLFRELHNDAEHLAEEAHAAHEGPNVPLGEDVGSAARLLNDTVGLLDAIGWANDGDFRLCLARSQARMEAVA